MGVVIHIDKRQLDITHLHARQGFLSEKIQTGFLVLIILKPSEGTNCRFFAHKHVSQQVFAPQNQSKDCLYFVSAFQSCV